MNSKDWQNQTRNLIAEYKDKKSINRGLTFEKFVNAKDGSQIFLTCVDYPIAPEYKYLAPYDNTIDNEQFIVTEYANRYLAFIKEKTTSFEEVTKILTQDPKNKICDKVIRKIEKEYDKKPYSLDDILTKPLPNDDFPIKDISPDEKQIKLSILTELKNKLLDTIISLRDNPTKESDDIITGIYTAITEINKMTNNIEKNNIEK